ncbi:hypothetical protein ACP70R_018454 [Stipagrostis hirtigluma subsp. patula]
MAPAHFLLPAVGALPAHSARGQPVAPVRFDSAARSRNRFHVLDTEGRDEGDAAAAAEAPWARPHAADEQPQHHHPAPPQELPGVVEPAPTPAPAPAPGSASAGFLRLVAGTGAFLFFASSAIAARPLVARVVFRALGTAGEPALAQVLADADRDLLAAWLRGRHSGLVVVAAGAALWALRVPGVAIFFRDAAAAAEAPWADPHAAEEQPQHHHPAPPQELPGVVEPAPAPAPAPAPGSASAGFLRLVAGTGAFLFFASSAIAALPLFARVVFRALGTAGEPALAQVLADADRDLLAAWIRGRHSGLVVVAAGAALWALRVPGVANFFRAAEADAAQQAVAEPAAWIRRPRAALLLLLLVFVLLAWAGAEHART